MDFGQSQSQLARFRAARNSAQQAAAQAAEQKKRAEAALDAFNRIANPHDRASAAERARLEGALRAASDEATAKKSAFRSTEQLAAAALEGFATFTDPRQNLGRLSDSLPFLLLPVRIETRFVHNGDSDELWVRIYPDDCSIDTFEPVLSDTELANAKLYWQRMWSAGKLEDGERAAWRSLVAAHGSGRASWIVERYQAVNMSDRPSKAAALDEILVIPTTAPPPPVDAATVTAYWQAAWLADGDAAKLSAARSALDAAVGAARAADLIANNQPFNIADKPASPNKKSDVALTTAFVVFPPDPATKANPWSQAPRVNQLADRFVVLGFNGKTLSMEAISNVVSLPLYTGPDPSADPSETIHPDGADLFVPDELAWLVDFDRAVNAGMGLRIALTPEQARTGFDRLLVLGVQLSANDSDATSAFEELLAHHHYGRSGLSIVPQGTPTHNSTANGTGYTQLDNSDQSFDDRKHFPLFTSSTDPMKRLDGDWLTYLTGISPDLFTKVHGSDGKDQMLARAMNCAMWPATLGYWMDKMMTPVFSDETVEYTRRYFTGFVSGRGAIPAIRIGRQPYGILPTTAFSRMAWLNQNVIGRPDPMNSFLFKLAALLAKVGPDWQALGSQASYVGKSGDAHQILLDILGLHPSSVEFRTRYSESLTELFNIVNLGGLGPNFWQALVTLGLQLAGFGLVEKLGYTGSKMPDMLQHVFMTDSALISNIIDDRPLSEAQPVRAYTDDHRNYIRWLIDAAKTSLDAVYQEQGFSGDKTPESLLYLYLRHAVTLAYYDSSYYLHRSAEFLSTVELAAMKPEPVFVHVADGPAPSESRFAALYKTEARITSSPSILVSDYITANLGRLFETEALAELLSCLETLEGASTASLERAFAEHIDCCSYRYDAWLLGLVNVQLQRMRTLAGEPDGRGKGLYLGAYGWVEDLRPSTSRLENAQLPQDLADIFGAGTQLRQDPANGGYIHAPSIPHAETAAVLRSGYLANATSANPSTLAVNLSSDRVRLALSMLEGIRNGQAFGALLGYQFERGLHDDHGLAEVDKFIYPMRKAFPLAADAISTTKTDPGVPIEAIEARNVMDGMKLVTAMRTTPSYPFGQTLPSANAAEALAINTEAGKLLDIYDAIADLALSEGVHQAVQGNFDRIGATLDAYTSGHFPPEPEVVQTPARGIGITQHVAIHFESGLAAPAGATPRAVAEPALDRWVSTVLPPLGDIGCHVKWTDPVLGTLQQESLTIAHLKLRPIDLLSMIKPNNSTNMNEIDDRVAAFVIAKRSPRPDAVLRIEYMNSGGAPLSVFEVLPLLRSLQQITGRTRPLRATDALLRNDATPDDDADVTVDPARITTPKAALDTLNTDISAFLGTLAPLVADPVANRAVLIAGIDGFIDSTIPLLQRAAEFALPSSGWGFAIAWKQNVYHDLIKALADLDSRWKQKLADYQTKIAAYDALPVLTSDDERFQALRSAEADIVNQIDPLPATPALLKSALNTKATTFATRLAQVGTVLKTSDPSFANLLATSSAIATSDLDAQPFDLTVFGDRAVVFAADLFKNLTGHQAAIADRSKAVQAQMDAQAMAATKTAQVTALEEAAKALFGPDFKIYPEFALTPAQGDEWNNAVSNSISGALTNYLTTTAKVDFPVDEWLYGIARVRPNMRSWEQILMLTGAFQLSAPGLVPAQFPYQSGTPWLALPYPPDFKLSTDYLLYTAYYSKAFDKTARQCGILLDEWTEVIPAPDRDTGITFNFDRPNNESPQTFLLVTPATANGFWQWDDLADALNETLDLAKIRAVEPVHIDSSAYSRLAPATVMAASLYGISITTVLATSNGLYKSVRTN
ncbi:hypothetical protein BJ917_1530 [Pseudomonas sp. WPR_5_2]|uniref:hypothetical protein n=1 Tax=Pseudomonas sp. WPR_5_2 TaxID=1907371 RepID=UPI000EAC17F6|nr:hypothetical protein [Pseudomonas sp. WPR_5_2]RKS28634.1 hypothetical protein BJ917_1530 [Pseudomonas sp. WPR_5_2]